MWVRRLLGSARAHVRGRVVLRCALQHPAQLDVLPSRLPLLVMVAVLVLPRLLLLVPLLLLLLLQLLPLLLQRGRCLQLQTVRWPSLAAPAPQSRAPPRKQAPTTSPLAHPGQPALRSPPCAGLGHPGTCQPHLPAAATAAAAGAGQGRRTGPAPPGGGKGEARQLRVRHARRPSPLALARWLCVPPPAASPAGERAWQHLSMGRQGLRSHRVGLPRTVQGSSQLYRQGIRVGVE